MSKRNAFTTWTQKKIQVIYPWKWIKLKVFNMSPCRKKKNEERWPGKSQEVIWHRWRPNSNLWWLIFHFWQLYINVRCFKIKHLQHCDETLEKNNLWVHQNNLIKHCKIKTTLKYVGLYLSYSKLRSGNGKVEHMWIPMIAYRFK